MVKEIKDIFFELRENELQLSRTTARQRIKKLKSLGKCLIKYRDEIKSVLKEEYNKPGPEVDLSEIYPLTHEIKYACKNLKYWMTDKGVSTPLSLTGASSKIIYEAKGISLILSPWNFPLQLALSPLISAVAAGCPVIIKPSELTPLVAKLMDKIVKEIFSPTEAVVLNGGVEMSQKLLELPFRHIFFTGSPRVGKIVMKAAAEHLSSVTLELGGKSPTVIDKTANIKQAAKRIVASKFFNAGQICIAPDYVMVHESKLNEFVDAFKALVKSSYTDLFEENFASVVNENHYNRLQTYVDSGVEKLIEPSNGNAKNCMVPMITVNPSSDNKLNSEEIFGPLMPIYSYKNDQEVFDRILNGTRPLALYVFSKNKKWINNMIHSIPAGGVCVNACLLHFNNPELPFGGVNNSGIGKSHGRAGFLEFTNQKAYLKQHISGMAEMVGPPYAGWHKKLIDLTIKWL